MPTSPSITAKVYLFDFKTACTRLQRYYTAKNAEKLGGLASFVLVHRNALIPMLGQIE